MNEMTYEERYQRRIDTMEWFPSVMTEEERLEKRRFEAYFAFETQWLPTKGTPTMICCLCGVALKPWHPGATGYGHNPDPLGEDEDDRCCDDCNWTKVIPARLGMAEGALGDDPQWH